MRNNRRKERRQRELVKQALRAGQSIVVDNTNPSAEDRRLLTAIGHAFGARIIGYYFEPDFELCVARNATRSGRDVVPYVGLVDVARRLRAPGPDEGFDELWTVRTTDGRFDVSPLPSVGRDG